LGLGGLYQQWAGVVIVVGLVSSGFGFDWYEVLDPVVRKAIN
jgi:hypothetical protein